MHISVISPVYGAAKLLPELVRRVEEVLRSMTGDYEMVLVEDNSPDGSWDMLKEIAAANPRVKALRLSRNFGQQNAINAGLDVAKGDWIVTMDCDLQDDPAFIRDMYAKAVEENLDIVYASRVNRQDGVIKKTGSYLFYKLLGYLSETEQDNTIANFILYKRKVVHAMASLGDYYRYYPMINKWVGFRNQKMAIPHSARMDDISSSYSFKKRTRLALNTIVAFSDKPLRLVLKVGIALVLIVFLASVYLVVRYLTHGEKVTGWLSLFISIWFLSGIIILVLGLIGLYIGKIFETVKRRPTYIVQEMIN